MKIDAREIAALTQAQPAAPRMDMYASIHKALRAFMADTLLGLGRMDVDDDLEFAQTCDRVMQLLDLCRAHLHHENQFVHAAMEARQPGSSQNIAGEHLEHEQAITALADGVNHLMACAKPARPAATLALYRQLALFVAHNFEHMHEEETAHNRVLWQCYTDAELAGVHDALVASIPPHEMMVGARWMVPYMSPAERTAMHVGHAAACACPCAGCSAGAGAAAPHAARVDQADAQPGPAGGAGSGALTLRNQWREGVRRLPAPQGAARTAESARAPFFRCGCVGSSPAGGAAATAGGPPGCRPHRAGAGRGPAAVRGW